MSKAMGRSSTPRTSDGRQILLTLSAPSPQDARWVEKIGKRLTSTFSKGTVIVSFLDYYKIHSTIESFCKKVGRVIFSS
jgi:hypothetical protein